VHSKVDTVHRFAGPGGAACVKIRLRDMRVPELGDKVSSRHGQKGVVGIVLPQHCMPFNRDGLVPDIIVNPHAFPSRMTIAHLLECLLSKACVADGVAAFDGTPFTVTGEDAMAFARERLGADHGCDVLYDAATGRQMECDIFVGPTYYQRLKHMVADKIHYRKTGPLSMRTRQPTQGRGNNGGLRMGGMEIDVLNSHGISCFVKETAMDRSDTYEWAPEPALSRRGTRLRTPYALKLLTQELAAMGVAMHIDPHDAGDEDEAYEHNMDAGGSEDDGGASEDADGGA
jgi:DNA-directed RNA polymerase beta subunit